jgi:hypothetical protein
MAKETDQTQETIDTTEVKDEVQAEQKDTKPDENHAKAVKTSEDFDKKLAEEGVDDDSLPAPKDSKSKKDKESETEDEAQTDDKNSGKADDEVKDDEVKDEQTQTKGDELKVSEKLAKEAVDLGLTPEEVAEFQSDDELSKTLGILKSVLSDTEDEKPVSQQETPPVKKGKETEPESVFKFENEDDLDPGLLAGIRKGEKFYQDQIKALSDKVDAMQSGVVQEKQREFVKLFDGMVNELGLEFADVFGKGSTAELSKRSMAFKNRDAVRAHMYAYARGLSEAGLPVPDEKSLFNVALHSLHGEKLKAVEGLRTSKKGADYAKGARVSKPATRKAAGLNPMQKAIETSRKFDDLIDTSEY